MGHICPIGRSRVNTIFLLLSLILDGPITATEKPAPNRITLTHRFSFVIDVLNINSYVVSR